ncbi:hypothetical protein CTZ27_35560 [Streptomyces griseocarneus]|nr:hypothetical protein CTZ27_35560 [Streptomyces griseocarneus]
MTAPVKNPSETVWNAWGDEGRSFHVITDQELNRFTRLLPIQRGHKAVDAGCGTGGFSRQLHRFGYDVTGVDFAASAIRAAARTPLPGVRYVHHDLNEGDPPGLLPGGIDLVVCRMLLPFLKDPVAWVRRTRDSWLRPGGRMYVVIPVTGDDAGQPGGVTEQQIVPLTFGWAEAVRYDLRGPLACLVLRSPAT